MSGSLALALVPLILGGDQGWPAWTWICLAVSVPAMIVTLRWERRLTVTGGQPLLDLSLFRDRGFRVGLVINIVLMSSFASLMLTTSLLLQAGLGASPLRSGLTFAPMALLSAVTSLLGRRLIGRFGRLVLPVGGVLTVVGALLLALDLHGRVAAGGIVLPLVLFGVGTGLVFPSLVGAVLAGVRPERAGVASGMLTTTQQFSAASGVAVIGAVFFAVVGRHGYVAAAGFVAWIEVGLLAVLTVLTVVFAPAPTRRPDRRRSWPKRAGAVRV